MQTATYTIEVFLDDVREVCASSKDALVLAQGVAQHMKKLLATPAWLEEKLDLPEEGGFGRYDLHYDSLQELWMRFLAPNLRVSSPAAVVLW